MPHRVAPACPSQRSTRQRWRIATCYLLYTVALAGGAVAHAQSPPEPLPVSALPLRLVGVIRDTSPAARSAGLIACGTPQERRGARVVRVGERVCDVAEVTAIQEEAVILRNLSSNALERLPLPSPSRPASATPIPPAPRGRDRHEDLAVPVVRSPSADTVSVELSRELLQRHLSNLPEVLTAALATPHYSSSGNGSGVIDGFEMSRIKPGGIVQQLGLQDGDVLQAFNGQKLDSLSAVVAMLGQAPSFAGATLRVLRNGTPMTFVFTVR